MEHLLQYVWMHKIFPLKTLETTDGTSLEIIDAGIKNTDAGPDFFNAKIKLGATIWVGNVEVHSCSSDWFKHGHDKDKAYDSIILHVAEKVDCNLYRKDGQIIPQFELICPDYVCNHYEELCRADYYPRCFSVISSLPSITIRSWYSSLLIERLEQKTDAIKKRVAKCNGAWNDAFIITLARNMGFGLNGEVFERWAYQLPFRAIDKHRDNLFEIEAFFFGTANLLSMDIEDEYYRKLQEEYLYLKHKFNLNTPQIDFLWKQCRVRPNNFFYIRIAQLAAIYQKEYLFSEFTNITSPVEMGKILDVNTSEYWDTHFSFTHTSPKSKKTFGAGAIQLIIINTLIPFLYAYGKHKGDENLCERALSFLTELKSEENTIIRQWNDAGLTTENAGDSQALIELRKEYCEKRKCLYCRFGYEFLRKK